jgi:Recombination endonuclease VII
MAYKNPEDAQTWRNNHKQKQKASAADHYKINKEAYALRARTQRLKKHGLTIDSFNEVLQKQQGLCAICGKPETNKDKYGKIKNLNMDHNHVTNKFRALLCFSCNTTLGQINEDVTILEKLIIYIQKHNANSSESPIHSNSLGSIQLWFFYITNYGDIPNMVLEYQVYEKLHISQ